MELEPRHIQAPELYGDFWFNGEPVSLRTLRGQVVMVDFWDYANTSCNRSLDYVREWSSKYRSYGMQTVGVHTPEFRFARDPENLHRAIAAAKIRYPVVADNDTLIWTAYAVRRWPTRVLIDKEGFIRFVQHGEGGYGEFERAIQQLLSEAGYRGELPGLMEPVRDEDLPGVVCYRSTGELYFGYLRGTLGNPEGYTPESTMAYDDPGFYLPERFYASGKWFNGRESLRFDGGAGEQGALLFTYEGREVNAVIGSRANTPCAVDVWQDDKVLPDDARGADVRRGAHGRLSVDVPRMYRLIRNKEYGAHRFKLLVNDHNLEFYSITFTTSVIPELISRN